MAVLTVDETKTAITLAAVSIKESSQLNPKPFRGLTKSPDLPEGSGSDRPVHIEPITLHRNPMDSGLALSALAIPNRYYKIESHYLKM
jgi:hypothetical protein